MNLEEIIRNHDAWDRDEPGGIRADLGGAHLYMANLRGANLSGAYLRGAYLYKANLSGASLRGTDLRGADLSGAYLREADLREADLRGADLRGANLSGAKMNWQSHALLSELLWRDAGQDTGRRMVAGLIVVSTDWCWTKFLTIDHEQRSWALGILRTYITPGDNHPKELD